MKKQADYIKRIEIKGLWGRKNISWELKPDVNILSGVNGGGKSTILNKSVNTLDMLEGGSLDNDNGLNVRFEFSPADATFIHYDVIRSFDRPLLHGDLMEKMADKNVKSELDWQLYQLQRRYLDYQVNVGNRIIECLTSGEAEKAASISYPKTKFQNLVDELFGETGKKILRKSNEILFEQDGDTLYPYQLSSGEKQMLALSMLSFTMARVTTPLGAELHKDTTKVSQLSGRELNKINACNSSSKTIFMVDKRFTQSWKQLK